MRICNASDSLSYLFFCTKKMKMFHDEQYIYSVGTLVCYTNKLLERMASVKYFVFTFNRYKPALFDFTCRQVCR